MSIARHSLTMVAAVACKSITVGARGVRGAPSASVGARRAVAVRASAARPNDFELNADGLGRRQTLLAGGALAGALAAGLVLPGGVPRAAAEGGQFACTWCRV